ncbi:hypothetical protein JYU04_01675 [Dehalococcoides mccartyi]|nr:hypothetical protein [Dehalococcoides mccartyi]
MLQDIRRSVNNLRPVVSVAVITALVLVFASGCADSRLPSSSTYSDRFDAPVATQSTFALPKIPVSTTTQLREPTESFTVHELDAKPKIGTVFETLLSRLPDNEITRSYTRMIDFGGALDALELERIVPGATHDEQNEYVEYLLGFSNAFNLSPVIHAWPTDQRDYRKIIDTYPDLAFDWMSVEASANSSTYFWGMSSGSNNGVPISYDVALGRFDPEITEEALTACDCDQPDIREHEGIEYFRWGEGDGTGFISDRNTRPFYDHIGRGPDLLVRDGEAYYSINDGVIEEHIEVIQGTLPSLADATNYVEAVQWMSSLGVISEITFRNRGFSTQAVVELRERSKLALADDIEAQPLLLPFEYVVSGAGFDGERDFTGLVVAHSDSESAGVNLDRALTRLFEGVARRQAPGRFTLWTELIDRIDIKADGKFLIARIYFTQSNGLASFLIPNTLLVHE